MGIWVAGNYCHGRPSRWQSRLVSCRPPSLPRCNLFERGMGMGARGKGGPDQEYVRAMSNSEFVQSDMRIHRDIIDQDRMDFQVEIRRGGLLMWIFFLSGVWSDKSIVHDRSRQLSGQPRHTQGRVTNPPTIFTLSTAVTLHLKHKVFSLPYKHSSTGAYHIHLFINYTKTPHPTSHSPFYQSISQHNSLTTHNTTHTNHQS